jgi:hypothetical protein
MNATQNNALDEEEDDINDLSTSMVSRFVALSAALFLFVLNRNLLRVHRLLNPKQLIAHNFHHQYVKVIV